MKIICQSCGAKYTIADEKVRGRTVKIRCKKCSSAIVVKGLEEMPPPEEEEEDDATRVYSGDVPEGMAMSIPPQGDPGWMVTLDDGAQREGSINELRAMYDAGTIHDDSFVWRDGMSDWQTLAETPELQSALRSPAVQSGPPRPTPSGSPAPGSPDAALGAGLFGGGGEAARVDSRGRDQDLFGAPAHSPVEEEVATSAPSNPMAKPPVPKFTAERGENSVLFTIDTIKAMGSQPERPAKAPSVAPDDNKIDIGALASVAPPPMSGGDFGNFDTSFDPGPSYGGGGSGGSLAAPMLPTTIEPEPEPEPEPMPYPGAYEPQPKSNKGIIIGLGAAVALLFVVSLAFGGYLIFGKGEEPVAANSATNTEGTEKAGADPASKDDDEDKADEDTKDEDTKDEDTKDEDTKDEDKADAGDDEKAEAKDEGKSNAKAVATVGGPLPTPTATAKKADKKADTKKDDAKKDDEKKEPPAPTTDKKFSRSAAISALGSAAGAASGCKKPGGPTGRGRVSVTFAPSGRVTTANVSGAFAGTSVGGCVAATFRRARVPAFNGSPVTVHKSFTIN